MKIFCLCCFGVQTSEGLSLLNNFSKHSPADSVTERQAGEKAGRERIQLSNQLSAKIKNKTKKAKNLIFQDFLKRKIVSRRSQIAVKEETKAILQMSLLWIS